jgi:hypothetical protein
MFRINLPAVMLRSKEVLLDSTSRLHRLSLHLVTKSSILLKRLNAVGFFEVPRSLLGVSYYTYGER